MTHSLIIHQAARLIAPLLFVLSLIALWRGHHLPGGGFIGGLLATASVLLYAKGYSWGGARNQLPLEPVYLMGVGLFIALLSGCIAWFNGDVFMTGQWLEAFYLPIIGKVHLGTPLLFDLGVYLTVIGFVLKAAFAFVEEDE